METQQSRSIVGFIQRAAAWWMLGFGVLIVLSYLVRMRFAPTTIDGVGGWSLVVLACAMMAAAIGMLVTFARIDGDRMPGEALSSDPRQLVRELLLRVEHLPDDADAARAAINEIGATYSVLAERLAQRGAAFPNQLEVQMGLGDVMVATQRVWTTLADGAPQHAAAAWHTARDHARRVHTLLA